MSQKCNERKKILLNIAALIIIRAGSRKKYVHDYKLEQLVYFKRKHALSKDQHTYGETRI